MKSDNAKILVATATYNEANNIREFVARVRSTLGVSQDILVIDDNSPDGTSRIICGLMLADSAIHLITRPSKGGLGSAHKLMKVYAMTKNYDYLVTMDADLSHRPEEIPLLLDQAGENIFVIGSRYVPDGKCDYVGFRKVVSLAGNFIARIMLGVSLREFTTSFRVFDVNLLKKVPFYRLKSNGYSYFMEVVSLMDAIGATLVEVPIHFKDRQNDSSKIPKSQAVASLFNLVTLALRRYFTPIDPVSSETVHDRCRLCGEQALLRMHDEPVAGERLLSPDNFKCSSIQNNRIKPALNECVCCGLIQSMAPASGLTTEEYYCGTDDDTYLSNFDIKLRTFKTAYKKLSAYLPTRKLHFLDIGSYYGAFLEILKSEGHQGCGIEPSKAAAQHSKQVFGHDVKNELFVGASQFPGMKFDVICAWDVIEHLETPDEFLTEVEKMLKDDGLFVFSTIIIDSLIARTLQNRWHWIIPMHLTYFKKRQIIGLLQKKGFNVLAYLNHTHYASLSYAVRGLGMNMSPFLNKACCTLATLLPDFIVVPIALGDVRMLICKKADKASAGQAAG